MSEKAATAARRAEAAEARAAGLHYRFDDTPGIRRRRRGGGFVYVDAQGKRITDRRELARIERLAVPPAWQNVWISPDARAHILATGRDARGRKQYRYHPDWRTHRDADKYAHVIAFARALPKIRAAVARDLALPGLPRAKVLAAIVRLLERSLIRVGNDEYARTNKSFGLTTLRGRHVDVSGMTVTFDFRGKSGKRHRIAVEDRRLARIVRRCRDLPGYELFQYLDDDGARHAIGSHDVNDYLHAIAGSAFSAKDFRTWAGTVLAAVTLHGMTLAGERGSKRAVQQAIAQVAARLGNTPAVCRKCYVHPAVLDAFVAQRLGDALGARAVREDRAGPAVLRLLRAAAKRGLRPTRPEDLTATLRRAVAEARP